MCCFYINSPSPRDPPRRKRISANVYFLLLLLLRRRQDDGSSRVGLCIREMVIRSLFSICQRQGDKDSKNIIVKCTLCSKSKDISTSRNSTSNLTKHLVRCHSNIKLVTKRKQTEDESGEKTKHSPVITFSRHNILPS